jgi:hypothetical protein
MNFSVPAPPVPQTYDQAPIENFVNAPYSCVVIIALTPVTAAAMGTKLSYWMAVITLLGSPRVLGTYKG